MKKPIRYYEGIRKEVIEDYAKYGDVVWTVGEMIEELKKHDPNKILICVENGSWDSMPLLHVKENENGEDKVEIWATNSCAL